MLSYYIMGYLQPFVAFTFSFASEMITGTAKNAYATHTTGEVS